MDTNELFLIAARYAEQIRDEIHTDGDRKILAGLIVDNINFVSRKTEGE